VAPTQNNQQPSDTNASDVTPQQANVTAQQGSLWAFLIAPPVQIYVPNDVPLNDKAQIVTRELSKRINNYPTVCGGGVFGYLGREYNVTPWVHGFTGAIGELDSRQGASGGLLTELGVGQSASGGSGFAAAQHGSGSPEVSGLAFGGVGVHSELGSASAGLVGFGPNQIGIGVYGEVFADEQGGGGAYVNISSIGRCR
jgi:hypothetical protein